MARIETDPNYSSPTFSRATAATDPFKKEDVQLLASAVSTHTHGTGKGLPLAAGAIPNGSITLAMLASDSVDSSKIVNGTIAAADMAAGAALGNLATASITRSTLTALTTAASTTSAGLVAVVSDVVAWLPTAGTTSILMVWSGSVSATVKGAAITMSLGWGGGGTFQATAFNIPDVNYGVAVTLWAYVSLPSPSTTNVQVYWGTNAGTLSMSGNRSLMIYEFAR